MNDRREFTYIQTNGVNLHVLQAGPEDGPLAILLHGFPEFWYGMRRQVEPLARAGFRVLVPDQRGYNLSDKPAGLSAYRLEETMRDVLGLIESSGRDKAILAGHDWGGLVAWQLALHHPERVERLVILNAPHPAAMGRALLMNPGQVLRSSYALFFQIPRLPEALLANNDFELVIRGLQNSNRPGAFTADDFEQYRRAWWRPGAFTAMLNWYRANFRMPLEFPADLRVRVPALILWGARDVALGRNLASLSADYCDDRRLVIFEGASHWLQHEEAGRVNQLMTGFLE